MEQILSRKKFQVCRQAELTRLNAAQTNRVDKMQLCLVVRTQLQEEVCNQALETPAHSPKPGALLQEPDNKHSGVRILSHGGPPGKYELEISCVDEDEDVNEKRRKIPRNWR